MKPISRRDFLLRSGLATAASFVPSLSLRGLFSMRSTTEPAYFEQEFGVTERVWRRVLTEALSRGGDYADLYFEHTVSTTIVLEDGKVSRAFSQVSLGMGVRTVKGDQVGYGFTEDLSEKALLKAAATAATIASSAGQKPAENFNTPRLPNYYPL